MYVLYVSLQSSWRGFLLSASRSATGLWRLTALSTRLFSSASRMPSASLVVCISYTFNWWCDVFSSSLSSAFVHGHIFVIPALVTQPVIHSLSITVAVCTYRVSTLLFIASYSVFSSLPTRFTRSFVFFLSFTQPCFFPSCLHGAFARAWRSSSSRNQIFLRLSRLFRGLSSFTQPFFNFGFTAFSRLCVLLLCGLNDLFFFWIFL